MGLATLINLNRLTADQFAIASDMLANLTALRDSVNSIDAAQINANAVTTSAIAALAVTAGKLANNAVGTDNITDLNVTTAKLEANVLTADTAGRGKMADGFLTALKLAAGSGIMQISDVDSYVGDSSAPYPVVTGVGFQPKMLLTWRADVHGLGFYVNSGAVDGGFITQGGTRFASSYDGYYTMDPDGFTVLKNTGTFFNDNTITHYFQAIRWE